MVTHPSSSVGHRPTRRPHHPSSPRFRLVTVWATMVLVMLGLSVRLGRLQLVMGNNLKLQAQEQRQNVSQIPRASRRPIVDRQGNVLAVDRVVYTIYAHPMLFNRSREEVAVTLGKALNQSQDSLLRQFQGQETGIQVAVDVSEELTERIRGMRLDGVELLPSQQRFYPQQTLMSQLVGYINLEGEPQAGLEYALQEQLLYDLEDVPISQIFQQQQPNRDDQKLQLTVDSRLQRVAQRNLEATVRQHGAKQGSVIVMDSRDGAVLALAVTPTYDPNRYYEADVEQFKNWVVSDLYEPGSTFKPINVAIALEEDLIVPDEYIYDEGRLQYDQWTIQNSDYRAVGGRGSITITDILRHSSNVGMVHIMERLKRSDYYDWLEKLGLGKPSGIELPAETPAQLKSRSQFVNSAVEAATTAFGQGFSLNPMQQVQLHAALANGGKLVTPHVVRGLVDAEGNPTWQPERPEAKQVFSPETTQTVVEMMEAVVESGSGQPARIANYRLAGKTGTAQKANEYGEYGNGRLVSFVGILPVENPRYVVLAVIDEPLGENAYGSTVAAPLVKSVVESLVVMAGVPPSDGSSQTQPAPAQ
ncbi:penicillin-binding protein 2 [Leptolyngbya cf. ectocarpi LEGE 11479]|uniref:Penicillin-binding protein 2 n=1 Tax=Leptolyngbya cf. ectocarpi LEGE 11479 TaxID=1828722 RepID=A0A928X128_LEPEC|nr:penicillin-binding protein 2 [Leptolyngbya ectocarpi]MBE9067140.1 penicillin-binding protein 2 [Leptolyngbya cf. ectocarpi LEGE 11479]